jgi:predicted HAD superfamily phosphohydrolase
MRNRAKCKKCNSIIESTSTNEYVGCSCGEIEVCGGLKMGCAAVDWDNFIRVDDNGNEIVPEIKSAKPVTRQEMLERLDEFIKRIEEMPRHAMMTSINHYDYLSLLIWLSSFLRLESESK